MLWSCLNFHLSMDVTRNCQSNGLYWHEPSDSFLFSFYTTNTVVEIDHQTGETLQIWGELSPDWGFSPEESAFAWQHGVSFTDAGTLLLSSMTELGPEAFETVAREYEIDGEAQLLREVWSFGSGEGIYAVTAGDAERLSNGNTLHNYGSAGRIREVAPSGELVWELDWAAEHLLGRAFFIPDLYPLAP